MNALWKIIWQTVGHFFSFFQIDQTCFPSGRKHTKTNKNMDPKEIKRRAENQNEDIGYLVVFSHRPDNSRNYYTGVKS